MVIAQWIFEITDILMNKIVSFLKKSVIKKNFAQNFFCPPNPKIVPTALGSASDVALSNIHERSLITRCFHLYKNTKLSVETP